MSEDQRNFIEVLKKQLIIGAIGYLFIVAGTVVGFYYKTNADISRIKEKQGKYERVLEKKASKEEVNNIKNDLKGDIGDIKDDVKIIKNYLINNKH